MIFTASSHPGSAQRKYPVVMLVAWILKVGIFQDSLVSLEAIVKIIIQTMNLNAMKSGFSD